MLWAASMLVPTELVLEKYRVVRELRRGRRGQLLLGWHEGLDAEVDLAVLDVGQTDPMEREHVLRDAERLRRLRDPILTEVRDVGLLEDGAPCVVLEPMTGRSLAGLLTERGPLPWAEAARVGEIIGMALGAKLTAGIAHGDLAPDDIYIGETGVRLVAFGVGRAVGLAPAKNDVVALGAVLAETLSGIRVDRGRPESVRFAAPAGLPAVPGVFVELIGEMLAPRGNGRGDLAGIVDRLGEIARAGRKSTLKSRD